MAFSKSRLFVLSLCLLASCLASKEGRANAWPEDTLGAGFGVAADPAQLDDAALAEIRATGFSYVRYDMRWAVVEHARGEYDWAPFDTFIAGLRKNHLKSVAILQAGNPVYAAKVRVPPEQAYGLEWTDPAPVGNENVKAFAAFAAAAVKHYGSEDIIWEIWNEPDILAFWPPKPDAAAFSVLATKTCHAMREANPQAVIIGPALARLPTLYNLYRADFLNDVLKSPMMGCLDAFSVHPYRHGDQAPETVKQDYDNLRDRMTKAALAGTKPIPIVNSEWGYSLAEVSPEHQAGYVLRTMLAGAMNGVPLSIWYEWRDAFADKSPQQNDREAHFGVQSFEGVDKPAAEVLKQILPHLRDAHVERRIDLADDKLYALLLRHDGDAHSILLWHAADDASAVALVRIIDGSESKVLPVRSIPRLVCTRSAPSVTLAKGLANDDPRYFIPCSR